MVTYLVSFNPYTSSRYLITKDVAEASNSIEKDPEAQREE